MAHPQHNFTSNFNGSDGHNAELTLNINGVEKKYTPAGNDQTYNVPGVARIDINLDGADLVQAIQTALAGAAQPVLVERSIYDEEYVYQYIGEFDGTWYFGTCTTNKIVTIAVAKEDGAVNGEQIPVANGVVIVPSDGLNVYSQLRTALALGQLPVLSYVGANPVYAQYEKTADNGDLIFVGALATASDTYVQYNIYTVSDNNTVTVATRAASAGGGGTPDDENGFFNTSLYSTPGDGVTESLTLDDFRIKSGTSIHGSNIEFVPTHQEGGVDFGEVWLNPGTYILNTRYTLQWAGNPHGTFAPLVCKVAGQPFDFSFEQENTLITSQIRVVTARQKVSIAFPFDADTPPMGIWVETLSIAQIASNTHPAVVHDTTLAGSGTALSPLGVTTDAFGKIKDIPTSISQFRAGDVVPVAGPNGPAKMGKDDLLINSFAFTKAQGFFAKEQDLQHEILRATARENEIEGLFSEPVDEAVSSWLDTHPEATTSVQDHSLTHEKLVVGTLNFVTPEMFGAIGDGVTDDTAAINDMLASGFKNYVFAKTYNIASTVTFPEKSFVLGSGKLIYTGSGLSPFIRVLSGSCIKGINIEKLGFAICGQHIAVDSCVAQGCTHSCFTIDVGEDICEHIRINNCIARSPDSHGFLFRHRLNGSTGNNSVANDIVFSNCAALHCGQGSSAWSCGFCFDVGSDILTAKNILFDNCYAYDSIESGFHFEQNIVCENIIFSNCVSNSNGVRKTGGADFGAGYLLPNTVKVRMYGCYATGNYRTPILIPTNSLILEKADVMYSSTDNLDNFVARPSGSIVFDLARNYIICKSLGIFTYRNFGYGDSNLNLIVFNGYKGNWTLEKNKLSFGDEQGLPNSKGWVSLQLFKVNRRDRYTLRFKLRRTTEAHNDVVMCIMLFDANGRNVAFTSSIHLARPVTINTDIDAEYTLNNLTYNGSSWDDIVNDFELASVCFNGSNHQAASQQAVITDLYVQCSPNVTP